MLNLLSKTIEFIDYALGFGNLLVFFSDPKHPTSNLVCGAIFTGVGLFLSYTRSLLP